MKKLKDLKVLYVNKNENLFELLESSIENIIQKDSLLDSLNIIMSGSVDVLITDISFSGENNINDIELIRRTRPNMPIFILNEENVIDKLFSRLVDLKINGYFSGSSIKVSEIISKIEKEFKRKALIKEENNSFKMLQAIMDSSKDIIFAIEHENIQYANKNFFDFFNVTSLMQFHSKHVNIPALVMMNPFSHVFIDKPVITSEFVDILFQNEESKRTIALESFKDGAIHIFLVKVSIIKKNLLMFSLVDISNMAENQHQLEKKAYIDPLTKVYNRRKFNEITHHYDLAYEEERCYGFLIIDIDHFKSINDTHGHDIGDETLFKVASLIKEKTRQTDILARWGGEEFVLMLPGNTYDKSLIAAENIRKYIEEATFSKVGKLTVSIGVAHSTHADKVDGVFKAADVSLYEAKKSGRNKVIGANDVF